MGRVGTEFSSGYAPLDCCCIFSSCCSGYCCFLDLSNWSRKLFGWYASRNFWYLQFYDCISG
ncbi:uncharacterized protein DS421_2g46600 [Arachis hypogaea]|nr:uncharacterized protein DS421_2g46600 [Arachis hypogaea]